MPPTSADPVFDAIIVAGAGSARLGGEDKALLDVGGKMLLERALASVRGARRTVVVGPRRMVSAEYHEETPAGGGPVAAFAAGLAHTDADRVVLLAVDLPFVAPAIERLLEVGAGVAVLVDRSGRVNYLASVWPRDVALACLGSLENVYGASMRSLIAGASAVPVADAAGWSDDCDTWESVAAARARAAEEGI